MEKKSIYNHFAKDIREEASLLSGSIYNLVKYKAITEKEAKRYRDFIYEFYKLSYEIEKK